jgi:lactate permease
MTLMRLAFVAVAAASVVAASVAGAVIVTSGPADQPGIRMREPAISVAGGVAASASVPVSSGTAVPKAPASPASPTASDGPESPGSRAEPAGPSGPSAATQDPGRGAASGSAAPGPAASGPAGAQTVPPAPAHPVPPGDSGKHNGADRGNTGHGAGGPDRTP